MLHTSKLGMNYQIQLKLLKALNKVAIFFQFYLIFILKNSGPLDGMLIIRVCLLSCRRKWKSESVFTSGGVSAGMPTWRGHNILSWRFCQKFPLLRKCISLFSSESMYVTSGHIFKDWFITSVFALDTVKTDHPPSVGGPSNIGTITWVSVFCFSM